MQGRVLAHIQMQTFLDSPPQTSDTAAMRNRSRTMLAALLVTMVAILAWRVLIPHDREPSYKGKPLSFWVTHCNYPKLNRQGFVDMEEALQASGTNSIPTL